MLRSVWRRSILVGIGERQEHLNDHMDFCLSTHHQKLGSDLRLAENFPQAFGARTTWRGPFLKS